MLFHDRRLQYMERQQISAWQASRPGDRILQLDLPLSYGIFDHFQDPNALNVVQLLWDPTKDVGVYIKVNVGQTRANESRTVHYMCECEHLCARYR